MKAPPASLPPAPVPATLLLDRTAALSGAATLRNVLGYCAGRVIGGERTPRLGDVRVQLPLVQITATLAALVDASEDAVVREVEQSLGLLGGQSDVRNAHGVTLGNGYDR